MIWFLIFLVNCLEFIFKQLFYVIKLLGKILLAIGVFFHKTVIFNIYKYYIKLAHYTKQIWGPVKNKYLFIFANKYITDIVVVVLAAVVILINLNISETRAETYGRNSILYSLAAGVNLEDSAIIEETISVDEPKIQNASPITEGAVTSETQMVTDESELLQQESDEELALTQGGTSLVKPEFTSIEGSKKIRDTILVYTVKDGDSIGSIASQFDLAVSTILWANNLSSIALIQPNQSLIIPPTDGIIHKIAKGDTLAKIAKKYNADPQKILAFNKLANESDLEVGSDLIVPEGRPYVAPRPAYVAPVIPSAPTPGHVNVPQTGKMVWPTTTHRISQYYSWRHTGLDINGEFGDPIWAAAAGIVTRVQYGKTGYGFNVIVDHGGGIQTLYAHFQKIMVVQGQTVSAGDVLGEEGSTGRSTGSHLHFEVRVNGARLNPLSYIR